MRDHLATLLDDFRRYGREVAVVRYQGNRRRVTTYGEIARLAGRFAALLAERGIGPGDRVLLWAENSAEWIAAFYGCLLRGVLAVPLDANGTADFAARVAADVTPKLAVGDALLLSQLSAAAPQLTFEDWLGALPAEEAGPVAGSGGRDAAPDSLHLRHHRRPQGHCAHARQRAGQRGPHRGRVAALHALRAADPSAAHSAHAAAEPRLRPDHGAVGSTHL